MVGNKRAKGAGRPRSYDPQQALILATDAFWLTGYSATSLDMLCEAMGLSRPSLYSAFGDKHALYLAALNGYIQQCGSAIVQALDYSIPLSKALQRLYALLLAVYLPEDGPPRGCFMVSTAVPEAVADAQIKALLHGAVQEFDRQIHARLLHARQAGELPTSIDPESAARIATAIAHTLAVRSRAGEKLHDLKALSEAAIRMICGIQEQPLPTRRKRPRAAAEK